MHMSGGSAGGSDSDATATGLYSHADLAPGSVLAGRFRIEALLGVGGMGVVYRATDQALGVPVALKLLRPEWMHKPEAFERFSQELLLARQVSSPHVVRIHDLAQHEGRWLISMDYVDGESLDRRLDRDGAFAVDEALAIVRQLAAGLAAAHAKGVIHRDVKPANVLLDRQGGAYLSDFGVARSLAGSGRTQTGAVIGTPDYLSPEQARGEPVDARSDLYALGLMLYEMLAGQLPFAGGTVTEVLAQRMLRTPPPLSERRAEVPAWVARLVDKLLRPSPAHRFQDAAAVIAAIDAREVPRDGWRDGGARRGAWLAALALVLAAGGGAWWWWQQRTPTPAQAVAAPLDRLLVLPLEAGADALPAERLAALGAHLRDALAAQPGLAVVDGERSAQALRQLDPTGAARPDPEAARSLAAARRVLRPRLIRSAGGWRLQAQLGNGAEPVQVLDGGEAADPLAALRAWATAPAVRAALANGGALDLALPTAAAALDAYGAGVLAQQDGRWNQALQGYRAATAAAPDYAAAWLAQGQAALALGEQDAAFDAIERGQAASGSSAWLRRRLDAEHALLEGDPPKAVALARQALAATPDDTEAALQLARAQGAGGDFNAAVAALQALTERDGNDPRAWYELGKFSILQGQARRAVDDYLVRALVLFKRSRNLHGEAETVNALGVGYGRLGQSADAAEQYRKAVEQRRALGNRRGVATSLRNLANVLATTGRFDEAAAQLAQARALQVELGDRAGLAATENELGLLAEERGDYRGALDAFRNALQSWRQADDPHGTAQALNNIGFADYQLGLYDDAQVYWQQAGEAYAALGEQTGRIRTEQNLGLLAAARGDWALARRLLEASLASAEKQQMLEEVAVSRRNLAELEWLQGHVAAAIGQAERAGALFRQRDDLRGQIDVELLQVQALLDARALARARALLDRRRGSMQQASSEQRAIADLLAAQLAAQQGRPAEAANALQQARRLAEASGVRQLQLQIQLEQAQQAPARGAGDAADLDRASASLGHAGLRLGWLEAAMRRALAAGDSAQALLHYRAAMQRLRGGDFRRAHALHRLGAEAYAAAGDIAGERSARAKAEAALRVLRDGLPEDLRAGFDGAASAVPEAVR
ncbi:tetratricopeptide repeat protein [Lysobacter sp. BMK333-48F3]|uniref:protein kinase domain-containing protein n=1 Tax=Lysobacter sp. BMK333-48F3 TaxID=2867962 RepID=UPI0021027F63|nr:tetratricopeptide repeat protein [Lysobacter sp. BMK333-48F3]